MGKIRTLIPFLGNAGPLSKKAKRKEKSRDGKAKIFTHSGWKLRKGGGSLSQDL